MYTRMKSRSAEYMYALAWNVVCAHGAGGPTLSSHCDLTEETVHGTI